MERIEFTPCVNPTPGLIAAGVTLAITLIALKALDRLNAGTGIAATIFSAGIGFTASSLHIRKEREVDWGAPFRIPKMQDNKLVEPWNADECTRIKGLDCSGDGFILREAALSGTIDMVRWSLDKAFSGERYDRARYDMAFKGPWPQFDRQALDSDHPFRDLHQRSGEERFKVVYELLDAVRGVDADPEHYTIPNALPEADRELLDRIRASILKLHREDEQLKGEVVDSLATLYDIDKAEMRELLDLLDHFESKVVYRIFGTKNASLNTTLEEVVTHPIAEWNDRTRALVRLHAHVNAKSVADLHLEEIATAKESTVLECLLHVAKKKGWRVRRADQKRLRNLAKS